MAVETERPSRRRHTEKDQIAHYELVAYSLSPNTSAFPDRRNWHRWSAAHRASSPHAMSSRKPGCASHRVPCSFLETCLDINAELAPFPEKQITPCQRKKGKNQHPTDAIPQDSGPSSQGNLRKPAAPIHDHLADGANYSVPRNYFESLVRQHVAKISPAMIHSLALDPQSRIGHAIG